jgi:ERCC4-related helicase
VHFLFLVQEALVQTIQCLASQHPECCSCTSIGLHTRVGASQEQRTQASAELDRLCTKAPAIANVTAEMTVPERVALYQSVKHLYVTTRIIVVDLLTERIPPHQVAGLLILNGHRVTEQSGEGFAVRLLRHSNKEAFVRALSDVPSQLSRGLSSLERSMQALHVREVFLWPRFRSDIQETLADVHVCFLLPYSAAKVTTMQL